MKGQATSALLDENLTCEFKRKIHSLSPSHEWKLSAFFDACEEQSLFTFKFNNLTRKRKKTSLFFEWLKKLSAVIKFILGKKLFNEHKLLMANQNAEKRS